MPQPNLLDCESFNPGYRFLSEKSKKLRKSSHISEGDALVLNDSLESVSCVGDHPQKKTNQHEDILIKVEDDMFEVDMLFHSAEATSMEVDTIIKE